MSYPKFLWNVDVNDSNRYFGFNDGTARIATLSTGRYDTILHVGYELQTKMNAVSAGFTVAISSVGQVVISKASGAFTVTWAATSNNLSTLLGFTESESVSSLTLTATNKHTHGWYPGYVSKIGSSYGSGMTAATRWVQNFAVARNIAGDGNQYAIALSNPIRRRNITIGMINRTELEDETRGLAAFESVLTKRIWFYEDRTVGTVGSYGTKNSATGYWLCSLDGDISENNVGSHPDWFSVSIPLIRHT